MASISRALVGQSGRNYLIQKVLKANANPKNNISLASSEGRAYVLKPVSSTIWDQVQNISHDLQNSQFVRLPVDSIVEESTVVYPFFTEDLMSLVKSHRIPIDQTKSILCRVLKGLKELHDHDWVHTDVKSNNVVVESMLDTEGHHHIQGVKLADIESAAKVKLGTHITGIQVGNVMWRSPEAQAGIGIGKGSDVFSFGIMCIHAVLRINIFGFESEKLEEGVLPEMEVLERMISYFGPVPLGLLEHINQDQWCIALIELNQSFNEDNPAKPFSRWVEQDFPHLNSDFKRFIGRMMNLDPAKRATVDEILEDPWWCS